LFALSGPLLWAAHFGSMYLVQFLACDSNPGSGLGLKLSLLGITILFLVCLAMLGIRCEQTWLLLRARTEQVFVKQFLTGTMRVLALLSFLAVLWMGLAILVLPVCGSALIV
jgi:hypothetical protein